MSAREIYSLGFSKRTINAILNSDITSKEQLYEAWQNDTLYYKRGMGNKAQDEIDEWASTYNQQDEVKIVQIAPIIEYTEIGSEDRGTMQRIPKEDATIYGLADDGSVYYWGIRETIKVEHTTPEELEAHDHEKYHYERQYGWKELIN